VLVRDVAREFDTSVQTVRRIRAGALVMRRRVAQSPYRVSFVEREQISRGIAAGFSARAIARQLGRAPSTVSREIAGAGGRGVYRALGAERRCQVRARRPKPRKLASHPRLLAEVQDKLGKRWSPQQISAHLRVAFPDDPSMRISHETIYLSLYLQTRGELRRQLTSQLRTGRQARKPQGRQSDGRGQIPGMVNISQRPAEIEDRAVPGHWEGDLILGAGGRSAIATLVERHTRYVMLAHLGRDRTTANVTTALQARIQDLPAHLIRSLTWDQGREMAAHCRFTVATGVQIYFCDPHKPWQRGSNENTNGLLRQYLPKGSDLAVHDQAALDQIAAELNERPRQTLDWSNPAEKMNQLLAGGC
jgi:transposase, IS30 family